MVLSLCACVYFLTSDTRTRALFRGRGERHRSERTYHGSLVVVWYVSDKEECVCALPISMTEDQLFELRRRVGIVLQESALFDSLTVRENVAFRLYEEGKVPEDEIDKRVREALSFVELEKTVDMYPSELSGGMRR